MVQSNSGGTHRRCTIYSQSWIKTFTILSYIISSPLICPAHLWKHLNLSQLSLLQLTITIIVILYMLHLQVSLIYTGSIFPFWQATATQRVRWIPGCLLCRLLVALTRLPYQTSLQCSTAFYYNNLESGAKKPAHHYHLDGLSAFVNQ